MKIIFYRLLLINFFLVFNVSHLAQSSTTGQLLEKHNLNKQYSVNKFLNPYLLTEDLNRDSYPEHIFTIEKITSKEKGIIIIDTKNNKYFILGAGNEFGNGGTDFSWADKWDVYKKKEAYETLFDDNSEVLDEKTIKLDGPALDIWVEEGSGGLIYWNGENFIWIHQGC